ncbi:hypothetical protein MML48_1g16757 [Holotrichia oblita]|uniref:Uncharacterized protein n=1 Tax=Holotrichia oblita TaxID=644536 RepID=A0ACB9TVI7_HOLOL|nr:hypothetical protein MML48_1g16757 [Holotrichia oblita]
MQKLEKSMKEATKRHGTKQKGKKKKEWLDEECKTVIEKRKKLRTRFLGPYNEMDKIKFQEQRKRLKDHVGSGRDKLLTIIIERNKSRRLHWTGHLERMEENRIVKTIGWREPQAKRKTGRPRRKCSEAIAEDLKEKQITNWRDKARNREEWKSIT